MSEMTEATRAGKTVVLPDGRVLGYAEYGDSTGVPVLHFHGTPSSRVEAARGDTVALSQGVRLIGIDRPGMGLSDYQRGRRILDWPDDVGALADALAIVRFAVLGVSGGGPYAAACAFKIPERLTACGIVSSIVPPDVQVEGVTQESQVLLAIARRLPWLLPPLLWWVLGRHMQDREKAESLLAEGVEYRPEPDRDLLQNPEMMELYYAETAEAFRQRAKGPAHDFRLYTQPWGFRLEEIEFGEVHLWHGELDASAPVAMGQTIAARIPRCKATFYPDDAHISTGINHLGEILQALAP
jgi:pimeloyl-ACP methyl ester carboxylesterase